MGWRRLARPRLVAEQREEGIQTPQQERPLGAFLQVFAYTASSEAGFLPRGRGGSPKRLRAREIAFAV
jgi:hypothetical protein